MYQFFACNDTYIGDNSVYCPSLTASFQFYIFRKESVPHKSTFIISVLNATLYAVSVPRAVLVNLRHSLSSAIKYFFQLCIILMFCHRHHLYGEARTAEDYAAENMG